MNYGRKLWEEKEALVIWVLVTGVLAFVSIICPPYYSMNDDVMMKSILSGSYTGSPDGHAVYMKYPISGVLSLLYRLTDGISWFDLMMTSCFVLAISAVVLRTLRMGRACQDQSRKWISVAMAGLLCLAIFMPHILTMHYTLVAAMLGSCALFLVTTGGGSLWVLMLLLCYGIRSQIFYLLLPFLGVGFAWRFVTEWKSVAGGDAADARRRSRKLGVELLVLTVGIVACMLWNGFMYGGADWQQYLQYNDSRTRLYDYEHLVPYEENRESFERVGISERQYDILEQYVLVLDEEIDVQTMEAAADITEQKIQEQTGTIQQWKDSVKEYYYHLRYTDTPYKYLTIVGYLLVFLLLLGKKEWLRSLLLCGMAGGRSLIWVYLIWCGRFPERIYVSLYFMDLMILAGMAAEILLIYKRKGQIPLPAEPAGHGKVTKAVPYLLIGAVCMICVLVGADQWNLMYERTMEKKQKQAEWEAMVAYCEAHPENLYCLDVQSMVNYSGKVWESGQMRENYLLAGGWMSGSPLLKRRLGDVPDGGALLLKQQEKCYYIIGADKETGWLQEYCESRFGEVTVEKVDEIRLEGKEIFSVIQLKKE